MSILSLNKRLIILISFVLKLSVCCAQVEDFLPLSEEDNGLTEEMILKLEQYHHHPLNLNQVNFEALNDLGLLDKNQIKNLIDYRNKTGSFISIYELQVIPGFDFNTIATILPYISILKKIDDVNLSIPKLVKDGQSKLFQRWQRVLEQKEGYKTKAYIGDQNAYLLRYRLNYENKMSLGALIEKDAGEKGFDAFSFHFYLNQYKSWIKGLAIGDYTISMGQGLIQHNGFGAGKSSQTMMIQKNGRALNPHTSTRESNYNRGIASHFVRKRLNFILFYSNKNVDQTIDTIHNEILGQSSLALSGLHRSESEISKKGSNQLKQYGGIVQYKHQHGHIALNSLFSHFKYPFDKDLALYNQHDFNGQSLANYSLDYEYTLDNLHLFGEYAFSDNRKSALLMGAILSLDPRLSISGLYRNYDKAYQVIHSNAFSESSKNKIRNEKGLYLGFEYFTHHWKCQGYFDFWKHDWLKYLIDAPSNGKEYLVRLSYFKKRKSTIYLQFKREFKARSFQIEEEVFKPLSTSLKTNIRFHINYKINKQLEWRNRIEFCQFNDGLNQNGKGFLMYYDLIYKPMSSRLHFTSRIAFFDTNDHNSEDKLDAYDTRIYAYENDILGTFSIPAYYHKGHRFYCNLRYKASPHLTIETRWSRTIYKHLQSIGSGLESIDGNKKSAIKLQVKWMF